jgi:hypothetical protein
VDIDKIIAILKNLDSDPHWKGEEENIQCVDLPFLMAFSLTLQLPLAVNIRGRPTISIDVHVVDQKKLQ